MSTTKTYAVAVDLGGTKIAVGLVGDDGQVRHRLKATVVKNDVNGSVEQIAALIREIVEGASLTQTDIAAVGICIPGVYFAETGLAWAPNVWGDTRVPLGQELHEKISMPIVIDSDRAAYISGEQWLGAARGLSDAVFLAVGTGIGAGIITGGRLCRGAHDIAGAVGWFALGPRRVEPDSQNGAFESEAAGPAVARKAATRIAAGERSSLLASADQITTEMVVEAAASGDPMATSVLEDVASYLGMGIANIISILNPQMVVLGGGLMNAGELMLKRIRQEAMLWAQPLAVQRCRIEITRLGEDAGLLGAARLAFLEQNSQGRIN